MTQLDERSFDQLTRRHHRELHVHCYRLLGSFDRAEELVQEMWLRAWRAREGFEGRSSARTWLYRIATNVCLEELRRGGRRVVPSAPSGRTPPPSAVPGLQPYPDTLLDEVASTADGPETTTIQRDSIELAFLAVLQLLPPRQRAAVVLRDVLGFATAETADLLGATVPATNSLLQRARATLQRYHRTPSADGRAPLVAADERGRALVKRYIDATERADLDLVLELLHDDVRLTISPHGTTWNGFDEVARTTRENATAQGAFRCLPTSANRHPAVAFYLRGPRATTFHALSLVVLEVAGARIREVATFLEPTSFERFGLPRELAATS